MSDPLSVPIATKACPQCGATLVIRTNRENGSEFMGCTAFPECRYTEPVPEWVRMRRLGAPLLPGFDP